MSAQAVAAAISDLYIAPDVEAGSLVHSVQSAVDALEDGLRDPEILHTLCGRDAGDLEAIIERLQLMIEVIDNGY